MTAPKGIFEQKGRPILLKCAILFLVLFINALVVFALAGTVNNFNGQNNPFNITFDGNNITHFINFPLYSNISKIDIRVNITPANNTENDSFESSPFGFSQDVFNDSSGDVNRYVRDTNYFVDGLSSTKVEDGGPIIEFNEITTKFYNTSNTNFSIQQWYNVSYMTNSSITVRAGLAVIKNQAGAFICSLGKDNSLAYKFVYWNGAFIDTGVTISNYTWYNLSIKTVEDDCYYYINGSLVGSYITNGLQYNDPRRFTLLTSNRRDEKAYWWDMYSYKNVANISILNSSEEYVNTILDNSCTCDNCSIINNNQCSAPFELISSPIAKGNIEIINISYEYGIDECNLYPYNVLNTTYRDQGDNSLIDPNVNYDLIFTESLGNIEIPVVGSVTGATSKNYCSVVNATKRGFNYQVTGEITLDKEDYGSKIYDFEALNAITASNDPFTVYDLYITLLNQTSTIVFTWLTNAYENIEGTMVIYRCEGNGTRTELESIAIINGEASPNIELLNTAYSYEVIYNGQRYIDNDDFTKCHIETQTTRRFFVNVQEDITPTIGLYSIGCNLSKSGNNTVYMQWGSNPENTDTITGCLYANRVTALGNTNFYINCTSTATSINRTIPQSGFEYNVYGKLFQSGYSISCDESVEFGVETTAAQTFGLSGVFALLILIVGMILLFSNEQPLYYPIFGWVGVALGLVIGFIAFGWITVSALLFLVIIVVIIGRRNKAQ